MSGYLEFYEDEIQCPRCGEKCLAQFIEDTDTSTIPPTVTTGFAGDFYCLACKAKLTDTDLPLTIS